MLFPFSSFFPLLLYYPTPAVVQKPRRLLYHCGRTFNDCSVSSVGTQVRRCQCVDIAKLSKSLKVFPSPPIRRLIIKSQREHLHYKDKSLKLNLTATYVSTLKKRTLNFSAVILEKHRKHIFHIHYTDSNRHSSSILHSNT